ncbi:ABC transporter ATP-binding protein/permease [Demequina sp.]|uniref:ABC transporter ATP-binding protein/permease n=1 Tax=Demequina sp. TaxID=2050685 RepID=UPI003A8A45C4
MLIVRPAASAVLITLTTALLYLTAGTALDRGDGALLGGAAIALGALIGLLTWADARHTSRTQGSLERHDRGRLMAYVFSAGPTRRTRQQTGKLVSTLTDAVERSAQYRAAFLGSMIGSLIAPLAVVAVIAIAIDWRIAAWLALAVPVIPLAIGGFQRLFRKVSTEYRMSARRLSAEYLDSLQGLPTLRAMGAGKARGAALAVHAEHVRAAVMRLLAGNQVVLFVSDAAFSLAMIALGTGLALTSLAAGTISAGQALAVIALSSLMTEPLDRIGQFFYIGMGGIAATKEIARTLASPVAHVTDESAPAPDRDDASVTLENVTFTYGRADTPVLDGFSLTVRPGERVVLTGRSGVGKSTVLGLIQGQLSPAAGTVRVGGHDVPTVPGEWLHGQIGIVAQQTYLFTGTLAQNLRLAAPNASDEDLWAALTRAHLADEVRAWPDGLDTPVGERGLGVSGGQAQRIGVARALLADAPILLLDEPTSQTDLDAEAQILAAIEEACRDRTVIAVGHTEAITASATRVIAMEDVR